MGYADRFVMSLGASTLQDDAQHHAAEPLAAAALADLTGAGFGALLTRVKYADGSISKLFESGTQNLAQLLRVWTSAVVEKGTARRWVKSQDIAIAHILYRRVAEASLAHWLDGKCKVCSGTGIATLIGNRTCSPCKGSGAAEITGMREYEKKLALDMVSELTAICDSHARRASAKLRQE